MIRHPILTAVLAALSVACCSSPAEAQPGETAAAALGRILDKGGKWSAREIDSARSLLRRGASLRTAGPRRGVTVLMLAARAGDLPLMRAALKAGVDVNARTHDGEELTALWFAMPSRSVDRVRVLLNAGADVNAADAHGRTPLMHAAHFKFRDGIRLLLARGASINSRNKRGRTALAYTDGHPGITHLLRRHGARE